MLPSFPFRATLARPPEIAWLALALLTSALILSGCGSREEMPIAQKRSLPEKEQKPRAGATSQERFRDALRMIGFAPQEPAQATQPGFAWDTPPGWERVQGSAMREVDFRFGKDSQGECYLMQAGGSLVDNVNRWRQQMGLPAAPEQEVKQLPKRPLFGREAFLITLDGDFTAMGAAAPRKDYRMIGVILPIADVSVFVKMVGPRADVMENEAKFQAFCDSLRIEHP